jgi:hypothetical protein
MLIIANAQVSYERRNEIFDASRTESGVESDIGLEKLVKSIPVPRANKKAVTEYLAQLAARQCRAHVDVHVVFSVLLRVRGNG